MSEGGKPDPQRNVPNGMGRRYAGGHPKGVPKIPKLLKHLRYVFGSEGPGEGGKERSGLAMLRGIKEREPGRFLAMLQKAEASYRAEFVAAKAEIRAAEKAGSRTGEPLLKDAGHDRVVALCDEILGELGVQP